MEVSVRVRTVGVLAILLFALASVPTLPATSGSAAARDVPFVHTPAPAPGSMVADGAVTISALVRVSTGLRSARMTVDGTPVERLSTGGADARSDVSVTAVATVDAGTHEVHLEVEDDEGNRAARQWRFSATDRRLQRLAGANRFETAVAVSQSLYPNAHSARAAVLARADEFADALTGAPLAVAVDGPLLLSARDGLPAATRDELRRGLLPGSTVHLLGGEAALASTVAREVSALGFRVTRHAGADRFSTAAAVARALPPSSEVVVASGLSFADALSASAPAARDGLPVLLTATDRLPATTAATLTERGVQTVTIAGGLAAVGDEVERELRSLAPRVRRVSGGDRYATAAAMAKAFYGESDGASLASGLAFPDALTGTRHAASAGNPLLLTDPSSLSPATSDALRDLAARQLAVYGGSSAVAGHVAGAAVRAAADGPDAPRVTSIIPAEAQTVGRLDTITVSLDRRVDPTRSSLHLEVAGLEVSGALVETARASTLTLRVAPEDLPAERDVPHEVRVVVATADTGPTGHGESRATYLVPDPHFASAGPVTLLLPSPDVEMVGYHESGHDGARQMAARPTATPAMTLPSRNRGTGSHTAADVVASPDAVVLAPATGKVIRAGSYVLYCRYTDNYAVIEPDARPGWEVKVLHFHGLRVRAGDRVEAGTTIIGDGPRTLPFTSQVDDYSAARNWPHLHVEVVDPSIPTRPGRGC